MSDDFKKTIKGVKPLKQDKINPYQGKSQHTPKKQPRPIFEEPQSFHVSSHIRKPVQYEEALYFARSGISKKRMSELKQLRFSEDYALDLHGLSAEEAESTLLEFLQSAHEHGVRHLKIIHGKGYKSSGEPPKIKNLVNTWLRQISFVLGFCSASPAEGGAGAVCVLLAKHESA